MATRTIKVKIAEERLVELEQAAQNALADGSFYVRVSAPELAVLVGAYREHAAADEIA